MQDVSENELSDIFSTAVDLARTAGQIIKDAFYADKVVDTKAGAMDLVTETDQRVENVLLQAIREKFPSHDFIGEESVAAGLKCELTDNPTWIIDPIDGTTNFVHRFPFVAVSIGIAINKEIQIGVIYNPILDQMYTAKKGEGSYLNGKKLQVSKTEDLVGSLLLGEFGSDRSDPNFKTKIDNFYNVVVHARGIRSLGSAALNMCQIASGVNDAYQEYGTHIWDVAAGYRILIEAGGVVMDPSGGPVDLRSRGILCGATEKLCLQISSKVKHVYYEAD